MHALRKIFTKEEEAACPGLVALIADAEQDLAEEKLAESLCGMHDRVNALADALPLRKRLEAKLNTASTMCDKIHDNLTDNPQPNPKLLSRQLFFSHHITRATDIATAVGFLNDILKTIEEPLTKLQQAVTELAYATLPTHLKCNNLASLYTEAVASLLSIAEEQAKIAAEEKNLDLVHLHGTITTIKGHFVMLCKIKDEEVLLETLLPLTEKHDEILRRIRQHSSAIAVASQKILKKLELSHDIQSTATSIVPRP